MKNVFKRGMFRIDDIGEGKYSFSVPLLQVMHGYVNEEDISFRTREFITKADDIIDSMCSLKEALFLFLDSQSDFTIT